MPPLDEVPARLATLLAGVGLLGAVWLRAYGGPGGGRSIWDVGVLFAAEPLLGGLLLVAVAVFVRQFRLFIGVCVGLVIGVSLQELCGFGASVVFAVIENDLSPSYGAVIGAVAAALGLAAGVTAFEWGPQGAPRRPQPLTFVLLAVGALSVLAACFLNVDNGRDGVGAFSIIDFDLPHVFLTFAVEPLAAVVVTLGVIARVTGRRHPDVLGGLLVGVGLETLLLFVGYVDVTASAGPAIYLGAIGGVSIAASGALEIASWWGSLTAQTTAVAVAAAG